jgi:hypothetical protein
MAVLLSSAALAGAGTPGLAQAHGDRDGKRGGHHGQGFRGKHHRHHGDRGLARTAAKLGVTKDQLKTALKTVAAQQQAAAKPAAFKQLLANELGVTVDQLKAAMKQARSSAHSREQFKQAFASALGKDTATVETAFKNARDKQKAEFKARRDAFIAALAAQLGVPVEKVDAVFNSRCGFKHH